MVVIIFVITLLAVRLTSVVGFLGVAAVGIASPILIVVGETVQIFLSAHVEVELFVNCTAVITATVGTKRDITSYVFWTHNAPHTLPLALRHTRFASLFHSLTLVVHRAAPLALLGALHRHRNHRY